MARYKLGDICEIVSGSTPKTGIEEFWDGNIKWITPAEINEDTYIINDSVRKITELAVKKTGLSPFPEGTVILSSRAPIGKVAIAGCEMYCNQGFKNLICSDVVYNKYLYWFLKGKTKYLNSLGRGATFKELSKTIVSETPIDVPSIDDQIKIVEILEKINEIIMVRKHELEELDKLIKARFVEMFGDPYVNPLKWKRLKIKDVVTIQPQNGLYKPRSDYVTDGSGTPILRIDGFYDGMVTDFASLKRLKCSETERQRYLLLEDDIVINRVNSIEYLGKCAHIKNLLEDTVYESNMMRMHFDPEQYNPVYICELLCSQFIYDQIVNHAKKAVNQASINQKDVLDFNIYQPPLDLQNEFAGFVNQVNKSKFGKGFDSLFLQIRQFYCIFPIRDTLCPALNSWHCRLLIHIADKQE